MVSSQRDRSAAIIDTVLELAATGSLLAVGVAAPNVIQILDKPLSALFNNIDARSREREIRRVIRYMKSKGLISYTSKNYEHGIKLTKSGRDRIRKTAYDEINIPIPKKWDRRWRLIFFDIPIEQNHQRKLFTHKLTLLGFQMLQRSIWVHPFACRDEIESVTEYLSLRRYVTYVEITDIDNNKALLERFSGLLKKA